MREIVFDTETTGLDPLGGDRIIEIAAVEIVNNVRTDNSYHVYVDPERDIPDLCLPCPRYLKRIS